MVATVAALSAGGLVVAAGSASAAAALIHVTSNTGLGVYNTPHTAGGKVGVPDMGLGDAIIADCWDRGDNLGGGNVWYHTVSERYTATTGQELFVTGWTYGAYVDGNTAFHVGAVPEC